MMDPLIIEPTIDTPQIILDKENNTFRISGNSFSDDPLANYMPVFEWINKYMKNPNSETVFEFSLNYLNTSSHKQIIKLLIELEKYVKTTNILIKWYYLHGDEDLLADGRMLDRIIDLKFEFIECPL